MGVDWTPETLCEKNTFDNGFRPTNLCYEISVTAIYTCSDLCNRPELHDEGSTLSKIVKDGGREFRVTAEEWICPQKRGLLFLFYFFYSLLFRDTSTSLVISRLESLGVYQKAVYFYCVVNVSFVKFTDFNFMIYEFDE